MAALEPKGQSKCCHSEPMQHSYCYECITVSCYQENCNSLGIRYTSSLVVETSFYSSAGLYRVQDFESGGPGSIKGWEKCDLDFFSFPITHVYKFIKVNMRENSACPRRDSNP